jgi:pimeloyl-ACP methyl ester carboxylesterase
MAQNVQVDASEEIVWIQGPLGRIFGILHRPASQQSRRVCLVMLNSGQISRVGPQRLYVKAARKWANLGYHVLRIDMAGVGDSQAENTVIHFDNHSPEEAAAAVRYARKKLPVDHVVLQGLCAGARAAIKCTSGSDSVDGVLSWSCPVFSAADGMPESPEEAAGRMSTPRARDNVQRIGGVFTSMRFLTLDWWKNRLRFGWSELNELGRALWHFARGNPRVTGQFLQATDQFLSDGRDVLFVYGDHDRISLAEFRERFADVAEGCESPQGVCVIKGGTHTFNSAQSQKTAIDESSAWLAARFPAPQH